MILPTTPAIHLLDSDRDVTARRYMLFNQAWLKQAHLGSGGEDLQSHLQRLSMFLSAGNLASSQEEFNNYVLTLQAIERPDNSKALALAALVTQVGDTPCTDLSEQGLQQTAALLLSTDLTQQQLTDTVSEVKKNYRLL